jgi:energy-coupling factor transporter ATP-binding protein EcfA2
MRLKRLTVKNVGVFDDASFEFPAGSDPTKADTYLFVGPNGSGKTTALLALAQFFTRDSVGLASRLRAEGRVSLEGPGFEVSLSQAAWGSELGGLGYECSASGF